MSVFSALSNLLSGQESYNSGYDAADSAIATGDETEVFELAREAYPDDEDQHEQFITGYASRMNDAMQLHEPEESRTWWKLW